ncbi:hypothetical protein FB45DRAFT_1044443 [Roridomyces roridus]|uniref:Uncharacterized protein n=1 Tax=Roridomyces roridus TaxID=1738132 RepID=A0AAD7F606_9AGAR|nr:hypothetical protein FB45DRAFT_1044443 [Roridomyces roridus]
MQCPVDPRHWSSVTYPDIGGAWFCLPLSFGPLCESSRLRLSLRRLATGLRTWFSRSGSSLPLTLAFTPSSWTLPGHRKILVSAIDKDRHQETASVAFQTLLRTLLELSPRLKVLKINGSGPDYVQEVFKHLSPADFPVLKTRVLTLSPPSLLAHHSIFWDILRRCSNLQICSLFTNLSHLHVDDDKPLHLERLERLWVGHAWLLADARKDGFRNWIVPNLSNLKYTAPDLWAEARTFWWKRSVLLENLRISRSGSISLALAFPDHFLLPLTPSTTHCTVLCPRLRRLNLGNIPLSDEAALKFVLAKMQPWCHVQGQSVHKLEPVTVLFPGKREVDIIPLLKERIANGLKAKFFHPYDPSPRVES